jgi:hypothetical protein
MSRLPRNVRKHRVQLWQRYEKQVPGHHIQAGVKLLTFAGPAGRPVRRHRYAEDVDLNLKLEERQNFYNYHRPHSALAGKTPYETLREKLNLNVAEARVE